MQARMGIAVGILMSVGCVMSARSEEQKADKTGPKTILFLGDSITRAGGYVRDIAAELDKQSPSNSWRVINHGRNSETLSNLSEAYHPGRRPCVLARIDAELAETKPDWVVACYGINDGIYHPYNEKRFEAYKEGVEAFIKKVQASGARVILLTPPPYAAEGPYPEGSDEAAKDAVVAKANAEAEVQAEKDPNKFGYRTPFPYYDRAVLAPYSKWLLTLNGRKDVWAVDLRGPMLPRVKESHGGDAIHPNGLGHSIMAQAFLKEWPTIQAQAKGM